MAMAAFAATATAAPNRKLIGQLRLVVNPRDGNGNQEEGVVEKVWWGRQPPLIDIDTTMERRIIQKVDNAAEVAVQVAAQVAAGVACSVQISGLPVFDNLVEVQAVEEWLQENFIANMLECTNIHLPPNSDLGFVTFSSQEMRDSAIALLDGIVMAGEDDEEFILRFAPGGE